MPATDPLFTSEEWEALANHLGFAPRQKETVKSLLDGLSDKQIADRLGIAVPTVRSYLQRLYAKHDVQDRTGLVVHIFREFRTLKRPSEA